jgi:hypothetical protein
LYEHFVYRFSQPDQLAEPTFNVSKIYSYMEAFQKNRVTEKCAHEEEEEGYETKSA